MRRVLQSLLLLMLAAGFPGFGAGAEFRAPPGVPVATEMLERWAGAADALPRVHGEQTGQDGSPYLNSLILERSPYLLQHANNPVNWVSWSEENLDAARSAGKLVFLSIGYSTCHWCHVMNRESFSDARIAGLINPNFVAIKVDREEMPVVDAHYSNILALVKGSAGWPLTAVLDADANVIFIDSYLAPAALERTLARIVELARTRPESLEQSAQFIASLMPRSVEADDDAGPIGLDELERIRDTVVAGMDPVHGGLAGPQKFPNEPLLEFLLAIEARAPSAETRDAIARQLTAMATGGLYDGVNGGFFRYATTRTWQVPHYEKMLYNQAQLLAIYAEAHERFGDPLYGWIVDDVKAFLDDWLYKPGQGFSSAIDAESGDVEGLYYAWGDDVLATIRSEDRDAAGLSTYPLGERDGLHGAVLMKPDTEAAAEIRDRLRRANAGKPRPFVDPKIITAWNAAVISAMARAELLAIANGRTGESGYIAALGERLWSTAYDRDESVLYRTVYDGERAALATLEDYAFLLAMLVDLYDLAADRLWLTRAQSLADSLLAEFLDDAGRLRPAADGAMAVIGRESLRLTDAELPAADAVALDALWRLAARRGDARLKRALERPLATLRADVRAEPFARLTATRVLADIELGSISTRQYFAAGNGKVDVTTSTGDADRGCDRVTVGVRLEDGWHVNSSQPLQDYLRPTAVTVLTPGEYEVEIDYPSGHLSKLGFQEEALSVYDGEFAIGIASDACTGWSRGADLTIDLQACTDEVCLLPETLRVRLPDGA